MPPHDENAILRRILRALRTPSRGLRLGPGDDAAVVAPRAGRDLVLTCDAFLENVHFLPNVHPPDAVGYKALARATSDLAAMGAAPHSYLLALALPAARTGRWLDGMLAGMRRAARRFRLAPAGGDTTRSATVGITLTVLGETAPGRAVRRSGACPGDRLYVSGTLGGAALGLALLRSGARGAKWQRLLRPHLYPEPRLALGQWLSRRRLAAAMIDISDGLSTDLHRLCDASSVGARVRRDAIPRVALPANLPSGMRRGPGELHKLDAERLALNLALDGGDDYELLFTVPRRLAARIPSKFRGVPLTCIGEITRARAVQLVDATGRAVRLAPRGWDPFRS